MQHDVIDDLNERMSLQLREATKLGFIHVNNLKSSTLNRTVSRERNIVVERVEQAVEAMRG